MPKRLAVVSEEQQPVPPSPAGEGCELSQRGDMETITASTRGQLKWLQRRKNTAKKEFAMSSVLFSAEMHTKRLCNDLPYSVPAQLNVVSQFRDPLFPL